MKLGHGSLLRPFLDAFPRSGRLEWIGARPRPRGGIVALQTAQVLVGRGLVGDHRARRPGSRRQITLIQSEHLDVIGALQRAARVEPELLRRNLVVSGISVLALKDQIFGIGEIVLEGAGPCEPCSRMESALGAGGYNAMRGHGGIAARVLIGGVIMVGDEVRRMAECPNGRLAEADSGLTPG